MCTNESMYKDAKKTNDSQSPELCVYAVMPFVDCYCHNISSSSIPKIAKYCMEGSSGCPVLDKMSAEKIKQAGKN